MPYHAELDKCEQPILVFSVEYGGQTTIYFVLFSWNRTIIV